MPIIQIKTSLTGSLLLLALTCLAGCSNTSTAHITWPAVTLTPELKSIYQGSCHNCHSVQGTGAPQTGDKASWNAILETGIDLAVDRAIEGIGGMPPNGQCFQCSPEQMAALIRYMSNPAQ